MRRIQFEGGPYDGQYAELDEGMVSVQVMLRQISDPIILESKIVPRPKRRGLYTQDPLDAHTFTWMGE